MARKTAKTETTNKATATPKKTVKVVYGTAPTEFPTIYINHAQIAFSTFDAALLLGEISGLDENGNIVVFPRAKLIMSHKFVQEFMNLIDRNIAANFKDVEKPSIDVEAIDVSKGESAS